MYKRMISLASIEQCSGCTACKAACPKQAISMVADHEGFLRPQIDAAKCVQCHACERACPVLHPSEPDTTPTCYVARTKDEALRMVSSSGGLFTELARPVLAKGGVVFGCVWEKPALVAIHAKAETEDELAAMRGSKYVQSDLRDTYREAKAELQKGRAVLFSGTPCQIAGLNKYLGKSYDNLLTVEIICHGVPSPAVFEKYKQVLAEEFGTMPTEILFKDKRVSWYSPSLVAQFPFGEEKVEGAYTGGYGLAFLNGMSIRPSCFNCLAKEGRSGADITLGDFWGIDLIKASQDNKKGVSCVLLHTKKAVELWNEIKTIEQFVVSYKSILKSNGSYWESSERNKNRAKFFREYHAKGIAGCDTKKHTFIMKVLKGVVRNVRIYLKCIG